MDNIVRYYVCGHTAGGYVNYLKSNLNDIQNVIILNHKSSTLKTNILRRMISLLANKKNRIEVIHSSYSKQYIDGVIIRDESIAFISNDIVDFTIEKAKVIDIESFLSEGDSDSLQIVHDKRKKHTKNAYNYFKEALHIHDRLEKIYIDRMDFNKANKVADHFIQSLFENVKKRDEKGYKYERLFGTNTTDGAINVVEHLIKNIKNRVYIKGRAGTGKSVFMRKVLDECQKYKLDVEVYYCSFDPSSIDMLIIRDLNYCLFDSTPPHEFFPEYEYDVVIDLYELSVDPGTDEQFKDEINRVTSDYKAELKKGMKELKKIKEVDYLDKLQLKRLNKEQYNNIITKLLAYV